MLYKRVLKNITGSAAWLFAIKGASLCKISFMIGSTALFFSGVSCVVPLAGALSSGYMCTLIFCMRLAIRYGLAGTMSYGWLALYVPGWCASLAWAYPSLATRVVLPLLCMGLFIVHPAGAPVWIYTLYWVIPVGVYFSRSRSVFLEALSATFIAHAVGSVIWQYTVAMTPAAWLLLVPIVAVERILIASGMTVLYYVVSFGKQHFGHYASKIYTYIPLRSYSA